MSNSSKSNHSLNEQELAKRLKAIQGNAGTIKTVADTVQFNHFTSIKENIQLVNYDTSELSASLRQFLIQLSAKLKNNTIVDSLDEAKQYESKPNNSEAKAAIKEIYFEIDKEISELCEFSDKKTTNLTTTNTTLQKLDIFNTLREEIDKNKARLNLLEKERSEITTQRDELLEDKKKLQAAMEELNKENIFESVAGLLPDAEKIDITKLVAAKAELVKQGIIVVKKALKLTGETLRYAQMADARNKIDEKINYLREEANNKTKEIDDKALVQHNFDLSLKAEKAKDDLTTDTGQVLDDTEQRSLTNTRLKNDKQYSEIANNMSQQSYTIDYALNS